MTSDNVLFENWHLSGVEKFKPRPQNKILEPLRGSFQNFRQAPPSILDGSFPGDGDSFKLSARVCFLSKKKSRNWNVWYPSAAPWSRLLNDRNKSSLKLILGYILSLRHGLRDSLYHRNRKIVCRRSKSKNGQTQNIEKIKSPLSLGYFDSSPRKLKRLTSSLDEIDVFVF